MRPTEKILAMMVIVLVAWISIKEARSEGDCLTQTMLNDINHEYIAHVNDNELESLYKEKEEFLNNIKSLPSAAKFGKSGKVNHIKQRIEDIEYRIAVKEAELSYHRKFAGK